MNISTKQYKFEELYSLRNKSTDAPKGFHPVYIKQKRVPVNNSNAPQAHPQDIKAKINDTVRSFNSNENAFGHAHRLKQSSPSRSIVGEIRTLLNKLSITNVDNVCHQIKELNVSDCTDDTIAEIGSIFLNKAITDKDSLISMYINVAETLVNKWQYISSSITNECVKIFEPIASENFNDIQKAKGLGLMKITPLLIAHNIVNTTIINDRIINLILTKIDERKNNFNSYATVALCGGCGTFIEMLCKFYQASHTLICSNIDNDMIKSKLIDITTMKAVPSRLKFMIQDNCLKRS